MRVLGARGAGPGPGGVAPGSTNAVPLGVSGGLAPSPLNSADSGPSMKLLAKISTLVDAVDWTTLAEENELFAAVEASARELSGRIASTLADTAEQPADEYLKGSRRTSFNPNSADVWDGTGSAVLPASPPRAGAAAAAPSEATLLFEAVSSTELEARELPKRRRRAVPERRPTAAATLAAAASSSLSAASSLSGSSEELPPPKQMKKRPRKAAAAAPRAAAAKAAAKKRKIAAARADEKAAADLDGDETQSSSDEAEAPRTQRSRARSTSTVKEEAGLAHGGGGLVGCVFTVVWGPKALELHGFVASLLFAKAPQYAGAPHYAQYATGDRCEVFWQGGDDPYEAVVMDADRGRLHVRYTDGTREDVPADHAAPPRAPLSFFAANCGGPAPPEPGVPLPPGTVVRLRGSRRGKDEELVVVAAAPDGVPPASAPGRGRPKKATAEVYTVEPLDGKGPRCAVDVLAVEPLYIIRYDDGQAQEVIAHDDLVKMLAGAVKRWDVDWIAGQHSWRSESPGAARSDLDFVLGQRGGDDDVDGWDAGCGGLVEAKATHEYIYQLATVQAVSVRGADGACVYDVYYVDDGGGEARVRRKDVRAPLVRPDRSNVAFLLLRRQSWLHDAASPLSHFRRGQRGGGSIFRSSEYRVLAGKDRRDALGDRARATKRRQPPKQPWPPAGGSDWLVTL
ncbi:hypothetical protein M885DRAFT_543812 [Pelagophyceae sp. CCMP2097]|nr:hypothetical protein M885DRAFT_543812 [Pelagophyceae sp. CCMP2097]